MLGNDKEIKKWEGAETSQRIELAIEKRTLIDNADFAKLKEQEYFEQQQKFKEVIRKIDSTQYKKVKQQLGDISGLTLKEIADSIQSILTPNVAEPTQEQENVQSEEKKQEEKKPDTKKETAAPTKPSTAAPVSKATETTPTAPPPNPSTGITKELQSGSITKDKLNQISQIESANPESVKLYLEFWDKVEKSSPKNDFNNLLKQIKNDNILKNSELKIFLEKIYADSDAFQKFNEKPGKAKCKSIDELNNLLSK
jgi:hypothetical protein